MAQIQPREATLEAWARYARAVVCERLGETPAVKPNDEPAKPVFVTIERKGRVLGCQGSLDLRHAQMAEEIETACVWAMRGVPVNQLKPDEILVTLTMVNRLEPLRDVRTLTMEHGLVLTKGSRTGIVLPFEGKEPLVRLGWAYRKAGLKAGEPVILQKLIGVRCRV
jgi:AMMECR1 domain-containing protein